MKPKLHSVLALALAAAALTARGVPPVVGGAVGAAGNLGVGLGLGNPGAGMSGAGAFGAGAGARGAGAAQGAGAFSRDGFGASFGDFETIGMRQERRAQADASASAGASHPGAADSHASVMGQARGISVATLAAGGASASLNTAETVHTIQAHAMAEREDLLAELHTRVDASDQAMTGVRKSGAKLDGDAKADFKAADADVKAKAKALKKSMKAAEKADADEWADARAKLATDYDAYAAAVAKAEAASRVETKPAEKPKG